MITSRLISSACAAATVLVSFGIPLPFHAGAADAPPPGFTALFNGKDLTGFRGGTTFDHRKLLEAPEDQRKAQIEKWTSTLTVVSEKTGKPHWYAENGELVNDGFG